MVIFSLDNPILLGKDYTDSSGVRSRESGIGNRESGVGSRQSAIGSWEKR
ncbi:MAG: hypothetical protein F6K26_51905 [Moorea sp. SIO2I5]|nr:hypothetical protein [Moorena sp. SIO2I5]